MLKNIVITGDTHGQVEQRLAAIQDNMPEYKPEETAVIILGDAGLNYWLNKTDQKHKRQVSAYGYTIYCVHGNHEARPCEALGMKLVNDEFVGGPVWVEEEFPLIRYFAMWGIYNIMGRRTLVIGGAYSVDKYVRLERGLHWFEDEQLKEHERTACLKNASNYSHYDLILSHTCPYSWRPTDLFLSFVDQSTVDNTMELWMDTVKEKLNYKLWLYAHYHADRIERPGVEIFYGEFEDLETIEARWKKYEETNELDWWLPKSPNYYMGR